MDTLVSLVLLLPLGGTVVLFGLVNALVALWALWLFRAQLARRRGDGISNVSAARAGITLPSVSSPTPACATRTIASAVSSSPFWSPLRIVGWLAMSRSSGETSAPMNPP